MSGFTARLMKATACSRRLLAIAAATVALPIAAHASVIETFDWVPTQENPPTGWTTTPHGTLQLTLSTWTLGGPTTPPNFGPYFSGPTGTATTANITGFTYVAANGVTYNLGEVTSRTPGNPITTTWQTSGLVTPAPLAGDPFPAPTPGYYLISGFTLAGSAGGVSFMMANNVGTAGATYANGVGNADFTGPVYEDGGYWKLETQAVPLPAALPLLLSGIGGLGALVRRRKITPI